MNVIINLLFLGVLVATVMSSIAGGFKGSGALDTPQAIRVPGAQDGFSTTLREVRKANKTVFLTMGTYGVAEGVGNVAATGRRAGVTIVVVMLDWTGYRWCKAEGLTCYYWECDCPYENGTVGGKGYSTCLVGISVCKMEVMKETLAEGWDLFFIEPDAALRQGFEAHLNPVGHDVVAACEGCIGSCALTDEQAKIIDTGRVKPPRAGYYQANIGMVWIKSTITTLKAVEATHSTARWLAARHADFKSFDQTILNRKLLAASVPILCLPEDIGGLNVRPRSKRPHIFPPTAWGVHAARLVSNTGFYKKAFLYLHGLWGYSNVTEDFVADVELWRTNPHKLKKELVRRGEM